MTAFCLNSRSESHLTSRYGVNQALVMRLLLHKTLGDQLLLLSVGFMIQKGGANTAPTEVAGSEWESK